MKIYLSPLKRNEKKEADIVRKEFLKNVNVVFIRTFLNTANYLTKLCISVPIFACSFTENAFNYNHKILILFSPYYSF